uniref:Uncharacterized protein n=1 Tax=Amphimedon queenslandica TaxID=400682 RepID=A0A1X7UZR9_AMPQE
MKIKEGLVYNKFTGEIVGFTQLGDVNDDLRRLEEGTDHPPSVATYTLALMVLSKTVADIFAYIGDESTEETQKFVLLFDKLFDGLNVRDDTQWCQKRKPDLKPYREIDDEKFESFIEMTKFLLTENPGDLFLSERISHDPSENYFSKQRARGSRNHNPTIQQCLHNAAAIQVQKSLATNPIHGNSKRNLVDCEEVVDDTPLPKLSSLS